MSINLKEATEFMLAQGYILAVGKGKFKLSTKFHQDYAQLLRSAGVPRPSAPCGMQVWGPDTIAMPGLIHITGGLRTTDWEQRYKQFIVEAQVPTRCETPRGEPYSTNVYSEDGMKAFRKALEGGAGYEMLVRATALYYKSGIKCKVAIGRFMKEGQWKTHYDELANAASQGTESLFHHVIKTIDNGENDHYELG